ncbi:uncharacterized protein TNCV_455561 [Trichonephila clavipes]|nr:uncharacterized protein TNCV_455561 [Trichonephila clavipes]
MKPFTDAEIEKRFLNAFNLEKFSDKDKQYKKPETVQWRNGEYWGTPCKSDFGPQAVLDVSQAFRTLESCLHRDARMYNITLGVMKFLDQTESGSTESNESVPSTSQQHLSESPLNLEVTTDAVIIATERRKSEIEIGSKACQS